MAGSMVVLQKIPGSPLHNVPICRILLKFTLVICFTILQKFLLVMFHAASVVRRSFLCKSSERNKGCRSVKHTNSSEIEQLKKSGGGI